jgi:hypothetical protein
MSIAKSNNQGVMKAMEDKGKSIMNEGNPSQIDLTFEVERNGNLSLGGTIRNVMPQIVETHPTARK